MDHDHARPRRRSGTYTLKISLKPNPTSQTRTARIVITCGTSRIEITITQEGTDSPEDPDVPSIDPPKSKWHLTRIENETVDIYGSRDLLPFVFEYDKNRRLTKLILGETEISGYTISYPDARTIKIENIPSQDPREYREFYTVTLDAEGRATEVAIREIDERETIELHQTYAYDAKGYCTRSELFNLTETNLHSRMEFTWESGNLTAAHGFDAEQERVGYTLEYTGYKNDPKLVNLDLNALFGAIPSADEFEGCSVILSMLDRTGLRSANLTKDDQMSRHSYDGTLQGEWFETIQAIPEPIVWTIDAEGRPSKAVCVRIVTPVKIHQTTGEVVPTGESKRSTDTYEFHYME